MVDKLILEAVKRAMRGEEDDHSSKVRALRKQFKPIFTSVFTYPEYGKLEQVEESVEESVERLTDVAVTLLAIVVAHELVDIKIIKELLTNGFLIKEEEKSVCEIESLSLKP